MSTLVVVDAVEKHWDATSGLRALTLEVREHELVVVRGRSGTGKSTLLSILAGWCEPDRGAVTWGPSFDGCDVTAWDQVAVVPQVLALMAELSARERRDRRGCGITGRPRPSGERGARVVAAHRACRASARRDLARQRQRTALARCRRRAQAPARGRAHESSGCGERQAGRGGPTASSRGRRRRAGRDPRGDARGCRRSGRHLDDD